MSELIFKRSDFDVQTTYIWNYLHTDDIIE